MAVLSAILIVSACTANASIPLPSGALGPTTAPTLNDACSVADQFLKDWEAGDYVSMYGLISAKSQVTSQTQFAAAYQNADTKMSAPTKTHTLDCGNAQLQGTTAAVTYDMLFNAPKLGEFPDTGRI